MFERAHDERTHREVVQKRANVVGVERRSRSRRRRLRALDELARACASRAASRVAQQRRELGSRRAATTASSSSAGRSSRGARSAVAELSRARRAASRPRACCEQRVDLDAGAGADRVEQQLGLAAVVGVDRTGREAGGAGDVLDPGAVVALRDEHLDRGGDEPVPGRERRWARPSAMPHDNGHYRALATTSREIRERCDRDTAAGDPRRRARPRPPRIAGAVVGDADDARRATLSEITGADVWLKFENLQFTASFKERGALNFLSHSPTPTRAAASWPRRPATTRRASPTTPTCSASRRRSSCRPTRRSPRSPAPSIHGADVVLAGDDFAGALTAALEIARRAPARRSCPRSTTRSIIAGQGTVGLEIARRGARPRHDRRARRRRRSRSSGIAVAAKALAPDIDDRRRRSRGLPGHGARARPARPAPQPEPTIAEGIAVDEPRRRSPREIVERARRRPARRHRTAHRSGDRARRPRSRRPCRRRGRRRARGARRVPGALPRPATSASCSPAATSISACSSSVAAAGAGPLGPPRPAAIEVTDRPGVLAAVADIDRRLQRGNIVDVAHRRDLPASR